MLSVAKLLEESRILREKALEEGELEQYTLDRKFQVCFL